MSLYTLISEHEGQRMIVAAGITEPQALAATAVLEKYQDDCTFYHRTSIYTDENLKEVTS